MLGEEFEDLDMGALASDAEQVYSRQKVHIVEFNL